LNEHVYNSIKKVYKNAYHKGLLKLEEMTKEREKMAYLPQKAIPLPNTVSTASGVKITEGNTMIFILPGVPTEMKAMFRNIITPILKEKKGKFIEKGFLFSGIGESWWYYKFRQISYINFSLVENCSIRGLRFFKSCST